MYIGTNNTPPSIWLSVCSCAPGKIEKMALNPGFMGVDLLLSSEWGQRVAAGMDLYSLFPSRVDPQNLGCADVADVAMAVKPRYHFAGTHGVSPLWTD